jgi:hypothetical protein
LRGVFAILFGIIALLMPGAALLAFVLLFAAYMLVDGILAIIAGVRAAQRHERWGWLIFEGILDLIAGGIAVVWPVITTRRPTPWCCRLTRRARSKRVDRTQPGLPIKPGRCQAMTHDYKRHGTTTLFAALSVLVLLPTSFAPIGCSLQRHRRASRPSLPLDRPSSL